MATAIGQFKQMTPPTVRLCVGVNFLLSRFTPGICWLSAPMIGATFAVTMVSSSLVNHNLMEKYRGKIDKKDVPFYESLALISTFVFSILFTGIVVKKALSLIRREISYKASLGLAFFDIIPFVISVPKTKDV